MIRHPKNGFFGRVLIHFEYNLFFISLDILISSRAEMKLAMIRIGRSYIGIVHCIYFFIHLWRLYYHRLNIMHTV